MLARLSKTLPTNVAVAGLTALLLGAGGTTATLAAGSAPDEHASDTAKQAVAENAQNAEQPADAEDADDDADDAETADDEGTRPTDTHGYCVSQIAQSAPTAPTGEGDAKVTHGTLVSAAAHACGKEDAEAATPSAGATRSTEKKAAAAEHAAKGKAHARHATGKPTG